MVLSRYPLQVLADHGLIPLPDVTEPRRVGGFRKGGIRQLHEAVRRRVKAVFGDAADVVFQHLVNENTPLLRRNLNLQGDVFQDVHLQDVLQEVTERTGHPVLEASRRQRLFRFNDGSRMGSEIAVESGEDAVTPVPGNSQCLLQRRIIPKRRHTLLGGEDAS